MYQELTIVGNLGADPEMRYTQDGKPVTGFSVAVNRTWKNAQGQKQDETTWFRVSAWDKLAEICAQYLHKGSQVLVVGEVKGRAYKNNQGEPAMSLEVRANTVRFIGPKVAPSGDALEAAVQATEDIPF